MKILVFGAGAVGSYYGGRLALAGNEVTLIGRKRHVEAIQLNGLTIDSKITGRHNVRVHSAEALLPTKPPDLVLLCVKSHDTEEAARSLRESIAPQTIILCLQNGIDNHEVAGRVLGPSRVHPTVIYVGVRIPEAGIVEHVSRGEITLPMVVSALCPVFNEAGIAARATDNILGLVWSKLLLNASCNVLGMICNVSFGELAVNQEIHGVIAGAVAEIVQIAEAKGIRIPGDNYASEVLKTCESLNVGVSSMLQDYHAGKQTEIDALNGVIVRLGKELGIATPFNSTLYAAGKLFQQQRSRSDTK